jgi:hypothetical protein
MIEVTPAEVVINRWQGLTNLARALGKPVTTVQKWKDAGTIHSRNWPDIEAAAFKEGWYDLTARYLGELHAAQAKRRAHESEDDKTTKCGVV